MDLPAYIRKVGIKQFAERFDVTERAALSWQYGVRRPRHEIASRIVSGSPVTWEGIYGDREAARSSRRKQVA